MSTLTDRIAEAIDHEYRTRIPWNKQRASQAVVAVVRKALLSDQAIEALMTAKGDEAECSPEIGGCGGTHTDCYYRGLMTAALDAIAGEDQA